MEIWAGNRTTGQNSGCQCVVIVSGSGLGWDLVMPAVVAYLSPVNILVMKSINAAAAAGPQPDFWVIKYRK